MKIKKLISGILASVLTLTAGTVPEIKYDIFPFNIEISANAVKYSDEMRYGDYLRYKQVNSDNDDKYDYIMISGCDKSVESINIPSRIDNLPVTNIHDDAFSKCLNLTEVNIPDSVTSIDNHAFAHCESLVKINIPESVKSIGDSVFSNCYKLSDIIVSENNNYYVFDDGVLFDKNKTKIIQYLCSFTRNSYTIPDSVTSIGSYAFAYCENLASIKIPDSVTSIGSQAFEYCSKLETAELSDNLTSIGGYAFYETPYYNNLKNEDSLYITPNGILLYIEAEAENVILPSDIKVIASHAVSNSYNVSVTINSDCIVNSSAFYWCENLSSVIINGNCTFYNSPFCLCNNLKSVRVNGSITGIAIFESCDSITDFSYKREILNYNITDNEENKVNIAQFHSVDLDDMKYNTYDNNTSCYVFGYLDILQEVVDSSGNIYAVYGCDAHITVIPENPEKNIFKITNENFTFGAAVIGDDDYLYVVWGKDISDDVIDNSMNEENIVICKYDLSGNIVDSLGLPVSKTEAQFPFDAGNANIDYSKGLIGLFWNTEWTNHHQGSEFASIDPETMTLINFKDWQGSHSFGVSMIPTNDGFAAVQMGDASARGINLNRYYVDDSKYFKFDSHNGHNVLYHSSGQYGSNEHKLDGNYTYTHMGGLARSKSTYAIAGKSERVYTSDIYKSSGLRTGNYDVFVKIADQTLYDSAAADCAGEDRIDAATGETADKNIIWLTECNETEKAGNVKIVTLEDGSYCVLWEKFINGEFDSIHYVIMDECGNILRRETEIYGARLSNTSIQPIVQENILTWAVAYADTDMILWYSVDLNKYDEKSNMFSSIKKYAEDNGIQLSMTDGSYGICGEAVYWAYDETSETLIIYGKGKINFYGNTPLEKFKEKIKNVIISDEIISLPDHMFKKCQLLESVRIPESLNSIGDYAFYNCKSLTDINISKNVTSIGEAAFEHCESLENINIPDNITSIEENTFFGCSSLKKLTIPKNTLSIGKKAFMDCDSLKNITVLNPDMEIGELALGYKSSYWNSSGERVKVSVVFYGYSGSTIESYAKENNFDFYDLENVNPEKILGDVDNDGKITFKDAVFIRRYIVGGWDVTVDVKTADVDGDGAVTFKDAVFIRRYIAGGWNIKI